MKNYFNTTKLMVLFYMSKFFYMFYNIFLYFLLLYIRACRSLLSYGPFSTTALVGCFFFLHYKDSGFF